MKKTFLALLRKTGIIITILAMVVCMIPVIPGAVQQAEAATQNYKVVYTWPTSGHTLYGHWGLEAGHAQPYHYGIDIGASYGSAIRAAANGKVKKAGLYGGYGYCVIIEHVNGECTLYGHNSLLLVKKGDEVSRGQKIAKAGGTGSGGASLYPVHCHFGIYKSYEAVEKEKNGVTAASITYNPEAKKSLPNYDSVHALREKICKTHKFDLAGICTECGSDYRDYDGIDESADNEYKTKFYTRLYHVKSGVTNAYVRKYPSTSAKKTRSEAINSYVYVFGALKKDNIWWYKVKYGIGRKTVGYVLMDQLINNYSPAESTSNLSITDWMVPGYNKGGKSKVEGTVSSKYPIRQIRVQIDGSESYNFFSTDVKKKYNIEEETNFATRIDWKGLTAGRHTIAISARDISGKTVTVEGGFYVDNAVKTPKIRISDVSGGKKVTFENRQTQSSAELWVKVGGRDTKYYKRSNGYYVSFTTSGTRTVLAYTMYGGKKSAVSRATITVSQLQKPELISKQTGNTVNVTIKAASGCKIGYKLGNDNYQTQKPNPTTVSVDRGETLLAYAERSGYIRSEAASYTCELYEPKPPYLMLSNDDSKVGTGKTVAVTWDEDPAATSYTATLYNANDNVVATEETTGNGAQFTLDTAGDYYITVYGSNDQGVSEESNKVDVTAVDPVKVTFRDASDPGTQTGTRGSAKGEGTVLNEQTIDYGETAEIVTTPKKEGYVFQGWDDGHYVSTNAYLKEPAVEDITYTAVYEKKEYSVKLYDTDGEYLDTVDVDYDESLLDVIEEDEIYPTVDDEDEFIGWQIAKTTNGESKGDIKHVDSDMEVHAVAKSGQHEFPVEIEDVRAQQTNGSQNVDVEVDLVAHNKLSQSFYMVVALKAVDATTGVEKTVYADRKIIYLTKAEGDSSSRKTETIRTKMASGASIAEVSILECRSDMNTGKECANNENARTQIDVSYDWDDDSWSEYSTDPVEESETRQVETITKYKYREKEIVYSGASSLSGYTKTATQYYNFDNNKWQSSSFTKIGNYIVSEPTTGTTTNNNYAEKKAYKTTTAQYSYAYVCPHKDWYWSNSGGTCKKGSSTSNMLKIYSSVSLAKSGYTKDSSDGSYKLPKTISTSSPGKLGTVYRIDYGDDTSVNTYTTASSDNHIWVWPHSPATRTLYQSTTVRSRNKFERWGEWKETTADVKASDTVQIGETTTFYRYRDAIPATASPVDVDPNGEHTRHFNDILEYDVDLSGRNATIMVYKTNNTDPNQYQMEYLGHTTIGEGNAYDFYFIPKEEPSIDTGNFIVALSVEGTTGLIKIGTVEVAEKDIPSYDVTLYYINDSNEEQVEKVTIATQSVKRHGNVDLSEVDVPEREGYIFVGWEGGTTDITKATSVKALYAEIPNAVAIVDWVKNDIDLFTAKTNTVITLPGTPDETNGYTFTGWRTPEGDLLEAGAEYTITGKTIIEAEYTRQEYTVKFLGVNGETIDQQQVFYGEAAEPPTYEWGSENGEFAGWSIENSWWDVKGDMEVRPIIIYNNYAPVPEAVTVIDEETGQASLVLRVDSDEEDDPAQIYYTADGTDPREEDIAQLQNGTVGERSSVKEYTEPLVFEEETDIRAVSYVENANISDILYARYEPYPASEEDDTDIGKEWNEIGSYSTKVKPNSNVAVSIDLPENPGLTGYSFLIDADQDVFSSDVDEYDEPIVESGVVATSGTQYSSMTEDGWKICWIGEDTSTEIGRVMKLILHTSGEIEEGHYTINVFYGANDTLDDMNEPVELENVKVTVDSEAVEDITGKEIVLSRTSFVYEGTPMEPTVTIEGLKEGEAFTVEYVDNINVGTAKAVITGIGDYTGTVEKEFVITQANIANADAADIPDQIWTGSAIEPEINLSFNGIALEAGKDYTVTYDKNTDVGTAEVLIQGIGNFKGSRTLTFEITESLEVLVEQLRAELAESEAARQEAEAQIAELTAAKEEAEQNVEVLQAQYDEAAAEVTRLSGEIEALEENATANAAQIASLQQQLSTAEAAKDEAEAALTEATNEKERLEGELAAANTAKQEAEKRAEEAEKALEEYKQGGGQTPETEKISLAKATVEGIKAKNYTGKAVTQAVTVKLDGKALTEKTDFTVSYKNNTNVGQATLTITGTGKYTGTVTRTFPINPKGTTLGKLKKGKKKITVKWKKQAAQTNGYQIRYSMASDFSSGVKTAKVTKASTTKKVIKKLKSKKKYYVQIRTYKTVAGKTYYSNWSKAKSVKIK